MSLENSETHIRSGNIGICSERCCSKLYAIKARLEIAEKIVDMDIHLSSCASVSDVPFPCDCEISKLKSLWLTIQEE